MKRGLGSVCALLLAASAAFADQYWIAYEGNDFPENEGWTRNWGNWQGQYQGPGAYRSLNAGVLTYDSLYDPGVFDFAFMERPGQIDPEPGELFVMEWRLKVERVIGTFDPDVALRSDDKWAVGLEFNERMVASVFEPGVSAEFTPGAFHMFFLRSWNMRSYELYIDGDLAFAGSFWESATQSYVGWGDAVQGAASLHHWDYFRFGVVPEPDSVWLLLALFACRWGSR